MTVPADDIFSKEEISIIERLGGFLSKQTYEMKCLLEDVLKDVDACGGITKPLGMRGEVSKIPIYFSRLSLNISIFKHHFFS